MRRAALLVLPLLGCPRTEVIAVFTGDGATRDAATVDTEPADAGLPAACAPPALAVGDSSCGGEVAARAFRFALCVCDDLVTSSPLTTDSFDSRRGAYAPGGRGGSVGTNGRFAASAEVSVGGGLWVGSALGIQVGAPLAVAGALRSAGPLGADREVRVGREAVVAGDVRALGIAAAGGLHVPAAAAIDADLGATTVTRAPVVVPPPCACDGALTADVRAAIDARAADNENAAAGLGPTDLADRGGPLTLELGCGRYHVTRIAGAGELRVRTRGRVAIYVAGDLHAEDLADLAPGPEGELDLFVGGQITAARGLQIGDPARPRATRLYVAGAGTIELGAGATIAGNLYAPAAEVVSAGPLEVYGSVFARRVAASGGVTIHYDAAVLDPAAECGADEDPSCAGCEDCPGAACAGAVCGPCASDADCCAPLSCVAGACLADPF